MKEGKMKEWLSVFLKDEEGASGIEYALIAAMVVVILVNFITPISEAVERIFTSIQAALEKASPASGG